MLFTSGIIFGQESSIYKNNGKLILDTIYSINPNRLKDFLKVEKYILPDIFNQLEYPAFLAKNSVEGIVIAKVTLLDDNKIYVEIVKSVDHYFDKSIKIAIDNKNVINQINEFAVVDKPFIFYLPFKFVVLQDTYGNDLKLFNSIVIKASAGTPYYERRASIQPRKWMKLYNVSNLSEAK